MIKNKITQQVAVKKCSVEIGLTKRFKPKLNMIKEMMPEFSFNRKIFLAVESVLQ